MHPQSRPLTKRTKAQLAPHHLENPSTLNRFLPQNHTALGVALNAETTHRTSTSPPGRGYL